MLKVIIVPFIVFLLSTSGCEPEHKRMPGSQVSNPMFSLVPKSLSGIDFKNEIEETKAFSYLFYSYMYNGGGVAVGDINKDGNADIYFSANQNSNKLYLNNGDFKFLDISEKAGVTDETGWSTGVSMMDFNSDGWLDIYVCKSGSIQDFNARRNKLFINNGDNTFTERAKEFGVDDPAFSTQAYYLDYDKDGDIDMYLVNHRFDFQNNSYLSSTFQSEISRETSDQLYRNDNGKFINVTASAGIQNKTWGLSAAVDDFNNDGWPDIYVCNDFFEPDNLYINNKDGTFKENIKEHFEHITFYSMGSDVADFNNDLRNDLIVLDMISEDHERHFTKMASMDAEQFWKLVSIGYNYQYMTNQLHFNNGRGSYSDIAQLSGVSKTDWSWAPLFADFDNDGLKDLFVTNGIRRDVTDNDYKILVKKRFQEGNPMGFNEVLQNWPHTNLENYIFRNLGNLKFEKANKDWGFEQAINSNGSAYADLDNDGDLDLIINNIDTYACIYQNNGGNNFISIALMGPENNPLGIGAKVIVECGNIKQQNLEYLSRGFQSSIDPVLHFGLGNTEIIDKVLVEWADGLTQEMEDVRVNQKLLIDHRNAREAKVDEVSSDQLFTEVDDSVIGIDFLHEENYFDDFKKEVLLPQKQSTKGPKMAKGDLNSDGKEDFFIGGAKGFASATYLQTSEGNFVRSNEALWDKEKGHEDLGALFLDYDKDGDQDLYVVSGGYDFSENDPLLQDRLYENDGKGNLKRTVGILPKMLQSGISVCSSDYDNDGDPDLFIGNNAIPGAYPKIPRSYLLENVNHKFFDKTEATAPELVRVGKVNDALFTDFDGDSDEDLIVIGEWMPISIFKNEDGKFSRYIDTALTATKGWWNCIESADFDNDGDQDYVIGNLGLNNKFHPSLKNPLHLYASDFDNSGTLDLILSTEYEGTLVPVRGKQCSTDQMPFISEKFPTYSEYAKANLNTIFGEEKLSEAIHYQVNSFESIYLENDNGLMKVHALPIEAQFGPILGIEIFDFNNDGDLDILALGAIDEAEVETVKYDALQGVLLSGNGDNKFKSFNSGLYIRGNAKDVISITEDNLTLIIVSINSDVPKVFSFK